MASAPREDGGWAVPEGYHGVPPQWWQLHRHRKGSDEDGDIMVTSSRCHRDITTPSTRQGCTLGGGRVVLEGVTKGFHRGSDTPMRSPPWKGW